MTSHERLDARRELAGGEGLREVVVGAEFEPQDAVDLAVAGGREQHGHRIAPRPQLPHDLDPVDAGKPDVDDGRDGGEASDVGEARVTVGADVHGVARLHQVEAGHIGDRTLVLDDDHQSAFVVHGQSV